MTSAAQQKFMASGSTLGRGWNHIMQKLHSLS
jgi:hypothetical protein